MKEGLTAAEYRANQLAIVRNAIESIMPQGGVRKAKPLFPIIAAKTGVTLSKAKEYLEVAAAGMGGVLEDGWISVPEPRKAGLTKEEEEQAREEAQAILNRQAIGHD